MDDHIKNAYEILDGLSKKSDMFGMVRQGFEQLIAENEQLKSENTTNQQAIIELTMLIGGGM